MDVGVELASLQFGIDFNEINILDGVMTPSPSPSPHIGLNGANFPPQEEEGETESPAVGSATAEPATEEAGAVKAAETVAEETTPNSQTLVPAASSPKEPIRVLDLGELGSAPAGQNNLSVDQLALQVANDGGASATPVVSAAVLNAPNVEPQSTELPSNGVHSNLPSSAVGLVPSIQNGKLAQVVYPSSNGQYHHLLMLQTPPAGAPNESMTNNQMMAENVAANNDLSAIFNQQPSFHPSLLQQNPAQAQAQAGVFDPRNLSIAPQRPWNPTWPQYNQIPPANSYAPNYMNWGHSNLYRPELYSYGEPNFVPMLPNPFDHQHGYRSILPEQVAPSGHAMYANYHPQPAPFVRTYNSVASGSSMPQRQRYPTLHNLQRNQNHSQMMMGNRLEQQGLSSMQLYGALRVPDERNELNVLLSGSNIERQSSTFSVPTSTSVSRFTAAQLPGSAEATSSMLAEASAHETTSSGSRLLSTRVPQHSWLSRKQAGEELMKLLNKNTPEAEVTSPAIRIGTRQNQAPISQTRDGTWMENLQKQLKRVNERLEESKKGAEPPVLGRRSRPTEVGESYSGFKRRKNNQGPSPQRAGKNTENEDRVKNTNSSPTRELVNGVYDPLFVRIGIDVDPHLRMFKSSQYHVRDISSDDSYPRSSV